MNDLKIPSQLGRVANVEGAEAAPEPLESTAKTGDVREVSGVAVDSVEQIAADVAAGRIGRSEAVARVLAEVMDSKMVSNVPEELRQEIETALTAMIEDDPYLRSLAAAIGPYEIE